MKSIDRLTPDDEVMLWADDAWPQDIGAVAVLDGGPLSTSDGTFRLDSVRDVMAAKIHLVRRFRQLLRVPPKLLGGPLWVDAPAFDIREHIRVAPLAAPGDEAEMLATVEQLRRRRLDRSRPLWEMWFMPGLAGQRVGLFMRTHHAVADGMAGVAALASLLDFAADAALSPRPQWAPAPPPADDELLADEHERRRRETRRAVSALLHPMRSARRAVDLWPALRELLGEKALAPTSLARIVGPGRRLALVRGRLDLCKEAAHLHGAKVNDVLLATIAGGLRDVLAKRGETVDGGVMRIYAPVTLRRGDAAHAVGNAVAEMTVPLPVGIGDPVERLRVIAAETTRRKSRIRPSVGRMPHGGLVGRAFLKLIDRQTVNVCSADLPGPPMTLYVAGARVLELFPLLPLIGKVSIGVGAISYAGQFDIMVVADSDAVPDVEVLAAGIRRDLEALTYPLETNRIVA